VPGPLRTFTLMLSATPIDGIAIVTAGVGVVGETGVGDNGVAIGADRVASGLGITAVGAGRVTVGEVAAGHATTEGDTLSDSACATRRGLHPIAIARKRIVPARANQLLILVGMVLILAVHNLLGVIISLSRGLLEQ
jgi:hypothetical protein